MEVLRTLLAIVAIGDGVFPWVMGWVSSSFQISYMDDLYGKYYGDFLPMEFSGTVANVKDFGMDYVRSISIHDDDKIIGLSLNTRACSLRSRKLARSLESGDTVEKRAMSDTIRVRRQGQWLSMEIPPLPPSLAAEQ